MKKIAFFLVLLFVVASVSKAELASGIMGYWPMNEGSSNIVKDVTVYGNNGHILTGLSQPAWAVGLSGKCVNFDGVDDRVVIENQGFFNFYDEITVAVWVNGPMVNNWQAFFSKGGEAGGWQIRRHENSPNAGFTIRGMAPLEDIRGVAAIDDNQWHLVLGTFDGKVRRIYVDGQLDIESNDSGVPNPSNEPLVFGAANFGNMALGNFHSGMIDEVAIWNRALSPDDANDVYNSGVPADLIHWRWNATSPIPADKAAGIEFAAPIELQWTPGVGAPAPVTNQVLLYGSNKLDVAYSLYSRTVGDTTAIVLSSTESSCSVSVASDSTYYWRVAGVMGESLTDPNMMAQGTVWSFETAQTVPSFTRQPMNAFADAGDDISFEVEGIYVENYQWYTTGDIALVNGSKYTGVDSAVLTINNVGSTDSVKDYYCKITNTAGQAVSDMANFRMKTLLGNWPLDGNTNEASNSALTGVVTGSISWVSSPFGTAASFDSGDYITIPSSASFDVYDALTVSVMVRNPGTSNFESFVSKNGENGVGWMLRQHSNSGNATFTLRGTSGDDDPMGRIRVDDGQWHNVIGVYDSYAGKRYLYVDGMLDTVIDDTGMITPAIEPVIIGRTPADWANYYTGEMAQVSIYNYPMDEMEIAGLYYSIIDRSFCREKPAVDLNNDCQVNIGDFSVIAESWLSCGMYPDCYQ